MTNRDSVEQLNTGLELFKAGRLQEAWETLAEVVDVDPKNFMALRLMGVIAAQCGNLPLAVELTDAALEIHPNDASAHLDYANMLGALGKTSESIQQYDESLRLNPDNYLAYYNKGNLLRDIGESQSALSAFEAAIWRNPRDPMSRLNKGLLEFDLGNFDAAIKSQKSGLCLFPSDKDQLHAIARSYEAKAENKRAMLFYLRSISLAKDYAAVLISYSNFLHNLSDPFSSLYALKALTLNPGDARAYVNLGVMIDNKQKFEEALWCHSQAVLLDENLAVAHMNRGTALLKLGRFQEALESHDIAIKVDKKLAEAHLSRGNSLLQLARFQEALESYDRAITLNIGLAEAFWNKSTLLLRLGHIKEGFALYNCRFRTKEKISNLRASHIPEFNGQDLENKSVRLYPEQGYGDLIQFARYAKLLAQKGAKVVLEVYPELKELFKTLDDQIEVVLTGDELPITDLICPLLNLPHLLGTQLDTIPWPGPYLSSSSTVSANRSAGEKPRIGVVWRGNPAHKNDQNRSIAFDTFKDLVQLPLEFVALQKGINSTDLQELKTLRNVQVVEDQLHDFANTATFIEALDLVITVDTSVAHLAGAMGKEVWILLAFMPDYRWMMDRTDTPWYPSARLYRQDVSRTWDPVLKQVKADLKIRFGKSWGI